MDFYKKSMEREIVVYTHNFAFVHNKSFTNSITEKALKMMERKLSMLRLKREKEAKKEEEQKVKENEERKKVEAVNKKKEEEEELLRKEREEAERRRREEGKDVLTVSKHILKDMFANCLE